jgi:hypothetical protein
MSSYRFIKLQLITKSESVDLLRLKTEFNTMAAYINIQWPNLSPDERKEWYTKVENLEQQIKEYEH